MSEMDSERFGQSVQEEPRFGEEQDISKESEVDKDEAIQGQVIRSTPFRSGIKSLAGLTLIAAAVFAAISNLGPMIGLSISFGVCQLLLLITFFTGIIGHRTLTPEKLSLIDAWFVRLALISMILFFGAAFAGGGQFAAEYAGRIARANKIAKELGFKFERIKKFDAGRDTVVVQVTELIPGGEFEKVGVLPGDIIVGFDPNELFQFLSDSQGEKVDLNFNNVPMNEPLMTSVDETKNRNIEIEVPEF